MSLAYYTKQADDCVKMVQKVSQDIKENRYNRIKLPKLELDLLKCLEDFRNMADELLRKTSERWVLLKVWDVSSQDCRFSTLALVLSMTQWSRMNAGDQRIRMADASLQTLSKVCLDARTKVEKKPEEDTVALGIIEPETVDETEETGSGQAEEQKAAVPARRKKKPKGAKPDMMHSMWMLGHDENLCVEICNVEDLADMPKYEANLLQNKAKRQFDWMVWMVHRVYLDDPTLKKLDFTNMPMPSGLDEPRISPKLCLAIETSTELEELVLSNSNLQGAEGAVLAVSLCSNIGLQVLNIDTNKMETIVLESILKGLRMNRSIREFRSVGVAHGSQVQEALLLAVKENTSICKVGFELKDQFFRGEIDKQILQNTDFARQKRQSRDPD